MLLALLSIVAKLADAPAVEPPRWVELDWRAPSECPDAAAVHEAIATMLPAEPERLDPLPSVAAIVARERSGFVLRLHLQARGAERTRELRAGQCSSLVDAVAVEVALLIAQRTGLPEKPPMPPASAAPDIARLPYEPPERRTTTPTPPPKQRPRIHADLRTGVLVAAMLPSSFIAPTLGAAAAGRRWSIALDLAAWLDGFARLPGRTTEGARMALVAATLSGCAHWPGAPRFALVGCAGLELGALWSRGRGLRDARRAADPSLAIAIAPALERTLFGPVRLALGPWLRIGVVRPGVRVDGVGEIHRMPAFTLGGALRVEVSIPGRTRQAPDI